MILTIYAVDDEPAALRKLMNYIARISWLSCVGSESNPIIAWDKLRTKRKMADIILLDIEIGNLDGTKLASSVVDQSMVVFTTAFKEHAIESYNIGAVDYLLKPFDFDRFLKAMERCRELTLLRRRIVNTRYVNVKDSITHMQVKLDLDSVKYFECKGNYTNIYLEDGSILMPILSLKKALAQFLDEGFIRVQKSYVVNLEKVVGVNTTFVTLIDGTQVAIGRTYRPIVRQIRKRMERGSVNSTNV